MTQMLSGWFGPGRVKQDSEKGSAAEGNEENISLPRRAQLGWNADT